MQGGTEVGHRSSEVTLGGQRHRQQHPCSQTASKVFIWLQERPVEVPGRLPESPSLGKVSHCGPILIPHSYATDVSRQSRDTETRARGRKPSATTPVRCPDAQVQRVTTQEALFSSFQT